jgi:DNA sulfur modification protein DndB
MCFVSRKKEEPIKGFQRLLNKKRAKDIANYLDGSNGVIPSALILSAQDNANIRYDEQTNRLSFEVAKDSMLVIDGQHRLYGLFEAEKDYEIPVSIFVNLNTSSEVKLFIDINTTQKGVPTALILDIKGQAGTETKIEERQRILFDRLNKDSALAGYFLPNESKAGKISRTVFNSSTKSLFEGGPVADLDDEAIYKTIKNYYEAIDCLFKQTENPNARLNKTVLFKAIMMIFNETCEKCLIKYKNVKTESFVEYLYNITQLNFEEYTGTNNATVSKIVSDLRNLLKEKVEIDEEMF